MADVPFYLQGTQTAGLFQPPVQSSPQGYVPGQGTAPYATPQQSMQNFGGEQQPAQQKMGINDFLKMHEGQAGIDTKWQQYLAGTYNPGSLSTFPGVNGTSSSAVPAASKGGMQYPMAIAGDGYGIEGAPHPLSTGYSSPNSSGGSMGSDMAVPISKDQSGLLSNTSGGAYVPPSNPSSAPNFSSNAGVSYPSGNIAYQSPLGGPSGGSQQLGGSGALSMQSSSPQDALAAYKNTPGYQLTNAPGAYQQSPGYQYAMDEAMRNSQGNASARGLLESGSALRGMNQAVQGVAQQDYNNWWQRQNSQFSDYQNRLAGLAGGNVGGDQAYNLGQAQAGATMQNGSNVASLFGNQGAAGYGGLVNTGAAQAGNVTNAGAQQAQVGSANASTQLAGAVYNRGLF